MLGVCLESHLVGSREEAPELAAAAHGVSVIHSTALSPPLFFLFPSAIFLHVIFRLVSFRPGRPAPARTVSGWHRPGVPLHPQAEAAPSTGAHAVGTAAPKRPGPAAPGHPAAAPAVSGETQATVSAATAAHEQGGSVPCAPRHHVC